MEEGGTFDRARALNEALPVARLRRALHLFRTWISAGGGGDGGGLAVSRHELAIALELPSERDPRVEFLCRTFAVEPSPGQLRVDLVTLLTTAALLSQGALEDKAALVFSLVDLDTEDDIGEHELALVIATCSDGLRRLGLVSRRERVSEMDAVALAYEAFSFAGVDVGDKMNLAAFMQWLTFHPRPQALFDRISCIFSMCDLAQQMRHALQSHERLADTDPLRYYNWIHLNAPDDTSEHIHVVTGPIIGRVTESTANILLEVDRDAFVKLFAFPDVSTANKPAHTRTLECRLNAFHPAVITVKGLSPGTAFIFRLLGVCRSDREKCIASIATFPVLITDADAARDGHCKSVACDRQLTIKVVNHSSSAREVSSDWGKHIHVPVEVSADPTVSLHYGFRFARPRLAQMLERIQYPRSQDLKALETSVVDLLKEEIRGALARARTLSLFRSSSNYIVDSAIDLVGDLGPSVASHSEPLRLLQKLARRVWDLYIGALWGQEDGDVRAVDLSGIAVLVHSRPRTASLTVDAAAAVAAQVVSSVKAIPLVSNVIVVTDSPLTPDSTGLSQSSFNEAIGSTHAAQWSMLQSLIELNKGDLSTKLCLATFTGSGGYETAVGVKGIKLGINQLVCGPSDSIFSARAASRQEQYQGKLHSAAVTMQYSKPEHRPHIGQITCSYKIDKSTRRRLGAVGSTRATFVPLMPTRQPELTLGPVVGFVSHSSAKILVEASDDVEIDCVLTGRLVGDTKVARQRVWANRPAIFVLEGLRPSSIYDISFPGMMPAVNGAIVQTSLRSSPAFRLTVLSHDAALDGSILEWAAASTVSSLLYAVSSNVLNPAIDLQTDLVLHLGCIASVERTFRSTLELWSAEVAGEQRRSELLNVIRDCVRRHWNLSENRSVLSRGSHWFSSVGVARMLLTRMDIPLDILQDITGVLREYEQVGRGGTSEVLPAEQVAVRLQNGVVLLALDTIQAGLNQSTSNPFGQYPDTLVSARQWEALEYWFGDDLSVGIDTDVNAFVVVCDLPLAINTAIDTDSMSSQPAVSSWDYHSKDQLRLLGLLFRRLHLSPSSCVVFLASGSVSERSFVKEVSTGLTFQHVSIGPVSQAPSRLSEATRERGPILIGNRYMIEFEPHRGRSAQSSNSHYSTVDVVPHPLGADIRVNQYADNQPAASLVVGPVIGRVTTRTARILIELDQQVQHLQCSLVDPASGHRVATKVSVKAFTPTVLKIEGLRPETRYHIELDGILKSDDDDVVSGYVHTPSQIPLTTDWLVVNVNAPSEFLPQQASTSESAIREASYWNRLTAPGMRAFTAQASAATSHRNGDTLGNRDDMYHARFNPWHHIHDEVLSDPLASPQLLLHLGGQVDMRLAFADDELMALVQRIAPLQALGGGLTDKQVDSELEQIRQYVRHRMQEVYRTCWGAPPMKTVLRQTSNCMLLDLATDVCFTSAAHLRSLLDMNNVAGALELDETALHSAASLLLSVAFELWQLYQNQLWTDLSERDLEFSNRSSTGKLAFTTTYGLSRLVFMNTNPEVHAYCSKMNANKNDKRFDQALGVHDGGASNSGGTVHLFSTATWRLLDEAVESIAIDPPTSKQKGATSKSGVQQLVVVVSADLVEWGGTNSYPELRPQVIRVLETAFTWKQRDKDKREVALIGRSSIGSSMSYIVADEKTNEKIRLFAIGSISQPQELATTAKRTAAGSQHAKPSSCAVKGHFSKRFTYRSALNVSAGARTKTVDTELVKPSPAATRPVDPPALYRTFASFQFLSDLRRGFLHDNLHFFPPKTPPRIVLGPVLGRMTTYCVRSSIPSQDTLSDPTSEKDTLSEHTVSLFALLLLLEVDASARVTCIVTDALAFQEIRVTEELTRNVPHVFTIPSLLPERRYAYRFEGVVNADSRRGCFHTPPLAASLASIHFICTSSNVPEHLDGSTDSLWAPIQERVSLPWSGIDFVVHLGGQVPLQEAAVECIEWVTRELKQERRRRRHTTVHGDDNSRSELARLREQVRKRMQQHYRRAWNLPNVREVLASCSNWFVRAQADVAPFFGAHEKEALAEDSVTASTSLGAARIVLEEAKRVVADYQLSLMRDAVVGDGEHAIGAERSARKAADPIDDSESANERVVESIHLPPQDNDEAAGLGRSLAAADLQLASLSPTSQPDATRNRSDAEDCSAQVVQHGSMAFFVCDMRSALRDDVVTCGGRLQKPLTQQEHAIIGERQWQMLENALKVKKTLALVLLLELPLVLTSAEHVDAMREEQRPRTHQTAEGGGWSLYDLLELTQHWVSCRRQLEQLLHVLFRWKLKRRGRDVLVVSGAMRIGIDSLVRDAPSGLSLRCVSVGPITARVETFSLPTSGVACPEFLPSAATSASGKPSRPSDSRFTFTHSALVAKRNYVLAQVAMQQLEPGLDKGDRDGNSSLSALINASFVPALDADPLQNPDGLAIAPSAHPVDLYRRQPSWWKRYIPMGRSVFWDDTVSLRAASDDELQAVRVFIEEDRALASALEVCYDKYQFAEAARLEELRSAHARKRLDLAASLGRVLTDIWRLVPDQTRRRMAYILDPYVSELLLGHLRASDAATASFLDGGVVELNAFARLCRSVLWSACLLRLSVALYEEDALAEARQRREQQRQKMEREAEGAAPAGHEPVPTLEAAKEARKQEKLDRKRAERLREAEEELAIAREQQRLNRLADSGAAADAAEFARASADLETRVRALDEAKKQREAEREMRGERKQRKREGGGREAKKEEEKPSV